MSLVQRGLKGDSSHRYEKLKVNRYKKLLTKILIAIIAKKNW